ncbi:MAG: phosphoribosylaminoimidazolesuccinocarboxamide synthase [Defluviitaleaceae bacterium]|nr:phosphoribosylaminoimidazolesuccinocarboxamide synthase [Defluviitaleaceae bacterium]
MELLLKGKTKNVYMMDDGNILLQFKDDATGKDGVFDPGENAVGLTIEGLGKESIALSKYFFELLGGVGVPTHFVSADLDKAQMVVKPAQMFGRGLEIVVRFKATGSYTRRYGDYIEEGTDLDALVEFTLKSDERADPPITGDSLEALGIMNQGEYQACKELAKEIGVIIRDDLAKKGLTLYDIKFEFGYVSGKIALVDEVSGGCMRAYKNNTWIQPMDLNKMILS